MERKLTIGLMSTLVKERYVNQIKGCDATWASDKIQGEHNSPVFYFCGDHYDPITSKIPNIIHLPDVKDDYNSASNLGRPSFPNNVFIYQNVQNLPYRFWTPQDRNDITILRKNINNALPFIPTGCVNDGNLTGVFSNEAVSVNTARELIDNNPGNNILVDGKYFISNSSSFVLPSVLTGKQITVIYV